MIGRPEGPGNRFASSLAGGPAARAKGVSDAAAGVYSKTVASNSSLVVPFRRLGPTDMQGVARMWTLVGIGAAVLVACAIFVLRKDEQDSKPDFFKRRARPF
jgi:hypothetical protein